MANHIHELAQEAFDNGNYQLALELFGHILQFSADKYTPSVKSLISIDTYIGYSDSLARCGHIRESFNVFAFICSKLGCSIPVHKLKHLTIGLLESVTSTVTSVEARHRKLSETQLPQKHLQHQQKQQKQHQPLNDSSECAKRVLNECSQQRINCNGGASMASKNHSDIVKQGDTNANWTAQEYEKYDDKQSVTSAMKSHHRHHRFRHHHHHHYHHHHCHRRGSESDGPTSGSNTECSVYSDSRCDTVKSIHCNVPNELDPLLCPMCCHVLVFPVTMNCGHTFCRDCVVNETQCQVCDKRFLVYSNVDLKQDVLITRLVEKWWTPHIQAETINQKTQTFLRQNILDEALKSCNEALEKCKYEEYKTKN